MARRFLPREHLRKTFRSGPGTVLSSVDLPLFFQQQKPSSSSGGLGGTCIVLSSTYIHTFTSLKEEARARVKTAARVSRSAPRPAQASRSTPPRTPRATMDQPPPCGGESMAPQNRSAFLDDASLIQKYAASPYEAGSSQATYQDLSKTASRQTQRSRSPSNEPTPTASCSQDRPSAHTESSVYKAPIINSVGTCLKPTTTSPP